MVGSKPNRGDRHCAYFRFWWPFSNLNHLSEPLNWHSPSDHTIDTIHVLNEKKMYTIHVWRVHQHENSDYIAGSTTCNYILGNPTQVQRDHCVSCTDQTQCPNERLKQVQRSTDADAPFPRVLIFGTWQWTCLSRWIGRALGTCRC
jgi:hypothetical protein